MADTRKDRRAPVSLKVRFKSATVDEFIEHYCKDVSRGGIFIKSSQPMAIGTLLKFQFQLKDESSLIKGVGRVVWTRSPDDAVADQPAGMGIKFIKMDNESRAIVDRIVESHGEAGGAFDEGRATASQAETPSDRPEGSGEGFFPDLGPAELPLPEDRTAVRQAAQFLAAALAEGGTDEAAAREAEQKAEEARRRTAQIEAERLAEAQRRSSSADASLPSMIIDPALGSSESKPPEAPAAGRDPSLPPPHAAAVSSIPPAESVTPVSAAPRESAPSAPPGARASLPPPSEPPEKPRRSPLLPATILVGVLAVAAWASQRRMDEPEPSSVEAPPAVAPAAAPLAEPEPAEEAPQAAAPDEEQAQGVDAAAAQEVPADLPKVEIDVRSVPNGAEVLVAGEVQGKAPLKLALPLGVETTVTARASGYAESSQAITPSEDEPKLVRFTLVSLPYVVRVRTTPEGAKISIGARRGEAGEEIEIGPSMQGMLGVIARLPGYQTARRTLRREDFEQTADKMLATLDLTLDPLKAAAPKAQRPAQPAAEKQAESEPAEEKANDSGAASGTVPSSATPTVEAPEKNAAPSDEPAEKPSPAQPSAPAPVDEAPKAAQDEGSSVPKNPF